MDGHKYALSVVDAGNIVIYIKASDLGVTALEAPDILNSDKTLLGKIENLRGLVCEKIGLVEHFSQACQKTPYQPFLCLLAKPADYRTYTNEYVKAVDVDLVARIYLMGAIVKAFPGTATACTGFAARIKGSVPYELLGEAAKKAPHLAIGHPTGIVQLKSVVSGDPGLVVPKMGEVSFLRTARVLMDGITYVRKSVL
jgi:2-methylaconitate cis-trans-isomerase PrpF